MSIEFLPSDSVWVQFDYLGLDGYDRYSLLRYSCQRTFADCSIRCRYQLGLHDTADALELPEKERVVRQRMLISLRIFDAYITSSLGFPRNLRVVKASNDPTDAPYIESSEMLTASNANLELLEILSTTRESIFFADAAKENKSPNLVSAARLQELSTTLDRWALKYHFFTRTATPSK